MVVGCSYLLFFSSNFFGPLSGFLVTLGVPLAAWTGILRVHRREVCGQRHRQRRERCRCDSNQADSETAVIGAR